MLSLTTDADGNEGAYAQQAGEELGVPALDVKVVPADIDRFSTGHGYNTSPASAGTAAAISRTTGKIRDKAQLLAGMQLDAAPETLWCPGTCTAQPWGRASPSGNDPPRFRAGPPTPSESVFDSEKSATGVAGPSERRDSRMRARDEPVPQARGSAS